MKTNPKVVEYHLEASAFNWELSTGKSIEAWGFNKQVPGPELRANVGDTMVVKVTNKLNESTTIHWHGIRLAAGMDGTDAVQKPISPGETFEYRFVVPDAGTFWYHSHSNETVQMEKGMYGALIVEDSTEKIITDAEQVFIIDDMKLDAKGAFTKPRWFMSRVIERHDGRQGDTLLINGKENSTIQMSAGQRERWRFINASSARYFVLNLGGREFSIVGTDGGLLESPRPVRFQLITPGERFDIVVGPFEEGDELSLESLRYNRMTFLKPKREKFATILVGRSATSVAHVPDTLRIIPKLAESNAELNRRVVLSVGPSLRDGMNFLINGSVHVNDKPVKVGELQVWEIVNASLMDHPFHLHGFFFQVLEENGTKPSYTAWKDTINLKPRSKVKIVWIPDNRPGTWMYHCHILEHHQAGMMANFEVVADGMSIKEMGHSYNHHH
jgi:FtsP/CotA-like multicopper oxidase with cupredoxin domain